MYALGSKKIHTHSNDNDNEFLFADIDEDSLESLAIEECIPSTYPHEYPMLANSSTSASSSNNEGSEAGPSSSSSQSIQKGMQRNFLLLQKMNCFTVLCSSWLGLSPAHLQPCCGVVHRSQARKSRPLF